MKEDKIEYSKELRDRVKNIINLDKSINYHINLYRALVKWSKDINNEVICERDKKYNDVIKNEIEREIKLLKLLLYGKK